MSSRNDDRALLLNPFEQNLACCNTGTDRVLKYLSDTLEDRRYRSIGHADEGRLSTV